MIDLIKFIDMYPEEKVSPILETMTDSKLEDLYCELVEMRERYVQAYNRVNNEYVKRVDKQIERINVE